MMLPIAMNIKTLKYALIGTGPGFKRRAAQLKDLGVTHLDVYEDRIPSDEQVRSVHVVLVVDIDDKHAEHIADVARSAMRLVNVEDVPHLCDFYYSSFVKQGDLTISVNTAGKSPTLTKRIKERLAKEFDNKWAQRLDDIAARRLNWRASGAKYDEVVAKSNAYIDQKEWLNG